MVAKPPHSCVSGEDINGGNVGYYNGGMYAAKGRCGGSSCALIVNPPGHRALDLQGQIEPKEIRALRATKWYKLTNSKWLNPQGQVLTSKKFRFLSQKCPDFVRPCCLSASQDRSTNSTSTLYTMQVQSWDLRGIREELLRNDATLEGLSQNSPTIQTLCLSLCRTNYLVVGVVMKIGNETSWILNHFLIFSFFPSKNGIPRSWNPRFVNGFSWIAETMVPTWNVAWRSVSVGRVVGGLEAFHATARRGGFLESNTGGMNMPGEKM